MTYRWRYYGQIVTPQIDVDKNDFGKERKVTIFTALNVEAQKVGSWW